jgi:hypothetical protein
MCAFCFVHIEVDDEDRAAVCESCGVGQMVYEDGSTRPTRGCVLARLSDLVYSAYGYK